MAEQGGNSPTQKHPGGRPLKFKDVASLQKQIDAYFADCDPHPVKDIEYIWHTKKVTTTDSKTGEEIEKEVTDTSKKPKTKEFWTISRQKHYTITGLANFLGTSRETLINYEERPEFFDTIKAAKDRVQEYWEHLLIGPNAAGIIFNLKNNYGWKDKSETDLTSGGETIRRGMSIEEIDAVLARAEEVKSE